MYSVIASIDLHVDMFARSVSSSKIRHAVEFPASVCSRQTKPGAPAARALTGSRAAPKGARSGESSEASHHRWLERFDRHDVTSNVQKLTLELVAGLALATYRKDEHGIELSYVAIQGYVAARPTAYDQLSHVTLGGATDQGVLFQDRDGLNDRTNPGPDVLGAMFNQVVVDAVQVVSDSRSQLDSRHP